VKDEKTAWPKGMGAPARNALESLGVMGLDDVTKFSEKELLAIHGVGPKAVRVIKAALQEQGKALHSEL
jgi:predicted flap endonuclease-1-like 5' DNA nuclease